MKKILVTGGAGFIGSNFARIMAKKHKDWFIVNIDALTYAGSLENLKDLKDTGRYVFIKADITDNKKMQSAFNEYQFEYVINFAAESHVDRSIAKPAIFLKTNVLGTQVLLESAKNSWQKGMDKNGYPIYKKGVKFLQISTDEVYGSALEKSGGFTENSSLNPNNPYAASKASADLFVRAYAQTYKLPVNITRCSNNYGPYQYPEKLIPLIVSRAIENKKLPLYGDGLNIRNWLHVYDNCNAIEKVLLFGSPGEIYNICGGTKKTNLEIVILILETLDKPQSLIEYVKDRPGHDRRYFIDSNKITSELGWKPEYTFEKGIKQTIDWYLSNTDWLNSRSG